MFVHNIKIDRINDKKIQVTIVNRCRGSLRTNCPAGHVRKNWRKKNFRRFYCKLF